jgi:curli production assembly/transport component CsgG
MKKITLLLALLLLQGCATLANIANLVQEESAFRAPTVVPNFFRREENILPEPSQGRIVASVYRFTDQTGQRRPNDRIAVFSSAVTQAPDAYLIKALQDVNDGRWFRVVERGNGLDDLVKERQLIRTMRDLYEGANARQLDPMLFSGVILTGGIIGYDSNTTTGGIAYRMLGIGPQTQYRSDLVTVNLRAVSVNTGEVLANVTVSKTIASYSDGVSALRFVDLGTRSIEGEIGLATNESVNLATQRAIETAVVELIKEGERRGHWQFRRQE